MWTFGKKKQVRFAYNLHTFHSPQTPALTFTTSTASSSAGPITPPLMSHRLPGPSPYTAIKPSQYVVPHPLLETSTIHWDLMEHFSTITRNNHCLSSRAFYEQATTPPLPFFSLTSTHLPWVIKIYASNGSYVTLGDVFDSIYRSMRTNITTTEFNSFPHQKDQMRATRAYEQRYRRIRNPSARDEERRGGMKRIDFFMGHTIFRGISNIGRRSDEWHLNVT